MPESSNFPIIGIDLGTTFSVVSSIDAEGRPYSITNLEGDLTTPSVVFLDPAGVIVGREAVKAGEFEPELCIRHPKRFIGSQTIPGAVRGEEWPPEVMQAVILRKLKLDAERVLGPLSHAVVTVPAYFNEPRRKATQDAAQIAGWSHVDILNEPTAAAIAYGIRSGFLTATPTNQAPETILVYDLGGGTFDVTLMRVEQNKFTVIATAGDVQLGGIDWDDRIVDLVADTCVKIHRQDPRNEPAIRERLRIEAESAKRTLTAKAQTTVTFAWDAIKVKVPITREQFEQSTGDLVDRTRLTLRRLLKDANYQYEHLTRVLLVGGSTRMPMIGAMLLEETGREPDRSLSPDEAVAQGAALFAASQQGKLSTPLTVINVNAHDLGVLGTDKSTGMPRRKVMIRKNTPLPAQAVNRFQTTKPGQRTAKIRVIEGGDDSGNGATHIGQCDLKVSQALAEESATIGVRFQYAPNGRLEVTGQFLHGQPTTLVIDRSTGMPEDHIAGWSERVANGLLPNQESESEVQPESADTTQPEMTETESQEPNPLDFSRWRS